MPFVATTLYYLTRQGYCRPLSASVCIRPSDRATQPFLSLPSPPVPFRPRLSSSFRRQKFGQIDGLRFLLATK